MNPFPTLLKRFAEWGTALLPVSQIMFWNRSLQWKLILVVIVATIIHYFFLKKILVPLQNLAELTRSMTEGKYPEPLQLTRDFNHLALS